MNLYWAFVGEEEWGVLVVSPTLRRARSLARPRLDDFQYDSHGSDPIRWREVKVHLLKGEQPPWGQYFEEVFDGKTTDPEWTLRYFCRHEGPVDPEEPPCREGCYWCEQRCKPTDCSHFTEECLGIGTCDLEPEPVCGAKACSEWEKRWEATP